MKSGNNIVSQNILEDIINTESIVAIFAQLLDNPDKKKLIIAEVLKRIISLSPVTSYEEDKAKKGESSYTTIDNIIGNKHGKFSLNDLVHENGHIYLQTINILRGSIHKEVISKKILLDITNVVFFGDKSEVNEKIKLNEFQKEALDKVKSVMGSAF